MKIINLLKGTKPGVSCELFPPKQGSQLANALEIVDTIAQQKPSFISVTYGAGGSNAGEAVAVAAEVHNCGVPSMAHLTCINADEQRIETVLGQLRDKGITGACRVQTCQRFGKEDQIFWGFLRWRRLLPGRPPGKCRTER